MKRLTLKQRKWLKAYLKSGNATEAARQAGYQAKSDTAFEQIGFQNVRKLQPHIARWIDEHELSETRLKELLIQGLTAKETKFFQHEGEVVTEREVVAWGPRRAFLDMALRVRGMYAAEKLDLGGDLVSAIREINERRSKRGEAKPERDRRPADLVGDEGGGEPEPAPEPEREFDFEIVDD